MLVMVRAVIVLVLLVFLPAVAHAEKRLALLIGNEAYASSIGALANPHNDVALLEQALKASVSRLLSSGTPASAG
jgi:competence protein ComGC